ELTVLAVSDSPSFTQDGGIIRLFGADKKIGIEINIDAAERARLRISSKLARWIFKIKQIEPEDAKLYTPKKQN
ncbi:MAG: YfiR family protein, partial [Proteobacteria bacterium]|nr:YfiR family protein [Pseudomonadota bacterium]